MKHLYSIHPLPEQLVEKNDNEPPVNHRLVDHLLAAALFTISAGVFIVVVVAALKGAGTI